MKTILSLILVGLFLFANLESSPFDRNQAQSSDLKSGTAMTNGKLLRVELSSQSLQCELFNDPAVRNVSIYLPPGYDQNTEQHYPVVYLLPWTKGSDRSWFGFYGNSSIVQMLNRSINEGTLKPMIVVSPDCRTPFDGAWFTNSPETGNWEDFIVKDVVNYIDQNYRTLPFAAARGIGGSSMGGYGALKLAVSHPETFGAVYALNALLDFQTMFNNTMIWRKSFDMASQAETYPTEDNLANVILSMAVAFSPDKNNPPLYSHFPLTANGLDKAVLAKWIKHDPMEMINGNVDDLKNLRSLTIDCSTSNAQIMLSDNFSKALKANGIDHVFRFYQGTDEGMVIQRAQEFMLPCFSETLAHSMLEALDFKYCYTNADKLQVKSCDNGKVFIAPYREQSGQDVKKAEILSEMNIKCGEKLDISLKDLTKGLYNIYGVSDKGFTDKPFLFGINGGVPNVKICVTSLSSGQKIDCCKAVINGTPCTTNADGELNVSCSGVVSVQLDKEGYAPAQKSATIYTDTVLNIALVKDSYVQVVEKGNGKPVGQATVIHNENVLKTGNNGYATLQNLDNGMLNCRIFKAGYITQKINTELNPGQTKIIELTPTNADVTFIVIHQNGVALSDAGIQFGETFLVTDQHGSVTANGLKTCRAYSYSVRVPGFEKSTGSFYLMSDTIIAVHLQDVNASQPVMSRPESVSIVTGNRDLYEGKLRLYPNPVKDLLLIRFDDMIPCTAEITDINGRLVYKSTNNETSHQVNLSSFKCGIYLVKIETKEFIINRKIVKQ